MSIRIDSECVCVWIIFFDTLSNGIENTGKQTNFLEPKRVSMENNRHTLIKIIRRDETLFHWNHIYIKNNIYSYVSFYRGGGLVIRSEAFLIFFCGHVKITRWMRDSRRLDRENVSYIWSSVRDAQMIIRCASIMNKKNPLWSNISRYHMCTFSQKRNKIHVWPYRCISPVQ